MPDFGLTIYHPDGSEACSGRFPAWGVTNQQIACGDEAAAAKRDEAAAAEQPCTRLEDVVAALSLGRDVLLVPRCKFLRALEAHDEDPDKTVAAAQKWRPLPPRIQLDTDEELHALVAIPAPPLSMEPVADASGPLCVQVCFMDGATILVPVPADGMRVDELAAIVRERTGEAGAAAPVAASEFGSDDSSLEYRLGKSSCKSWSMIALIEALFKCFLQLDPSCMSKGVGLYSESFDGGDDGEGLSPLPADARVRPGEAFFGLPDNVLSDMLESTVEPAVEAFIEMHQTGVKKLGQRVQKMIDADVDAARKTLVDSYRGILIELSRIALFNAKKISELRREKDGVEKELKGISSHWKDWTKRDWKMQDERINLKSQIQTLQDHEAIFKTVVGRIKWLTINDAKNVAKRQLMTVSDRARERVKQSMYDAKQAAKEAAKEERKQKRAADRAASVGAKRQKTAVEVAPPAAAGGGGDVIELCFSDDEHEDEGGGSAACRTASSPPCKKARH